MTNAQILVVEDDRIVARDIENSLGSFGYTVCAVVSSGAEASQKVSETGPDLVLMDIKLRGAMDGVEAAEEIRTRFDIPVIYLTAYVDDNTLQRARLTEPYGYILKPFTERELYTAIEVALYKHQTERRLKEWVATTLKSIGDGVITTNTRGLVTFMNPVAEALTGWRQEDALGQDSGEVFNIIEEETGSPIQSPAIRAIEAQVVTNLADQTILIARDERQIPIINRAAPIRDDKGEISGAVLTFYDITERKQAEAELKVRVRQQEAVAQLGQEVLEGTDLFTLIDKTVWLVAQTLEVEYSLVLKLLPDADILLLEAGAGWQEGVVGQATIEANISSLTGYTLLSSEPVIVQDLDQETEFSAPAWFYDHRVVSGLSVVIHGQDWPFGVLGAYTTRRRRFSKDDIHFLQAVANVLAETIQRWWAGEEMRKLSNALEQIAEAVVITNCEGVIEYVNPAFEQITGYSKEEVLGKTPRILKSGQHQPAFYERMWKTLLSGEGFRSVITNRKKSGELYYSEENITPLKDSRGHITHFVSTGRDITARRQAQQALQESQARLAEAQRMARLGNWDWNTGTNELRWSDEVYRIFGLIPQEVKITYETFLKAVHPQDREFVQRSVKAALYEHKPYSIDHRIIRADGETGIIHEEAEVSYDESGRPIGMVGTTQDITERKQLEARLTAIYQLGQELTLLHDETRITQPVLETATNLLQFEVAGYGLVDKTSGELAYRYQLVNGALEPIDLRLPLDGEEGIGVIVARTGQAINVPDITKEPRYVHIQENWLCRSELCVPMKVGERIIGVLNAESIKSNYFTAADQQLLQTLADQTAVALENARLHAETERRARELAALNKAGRVMASSLDLNTVLEQSLVEVKSMLEAEGASVLLYELNSEKLVFAAAASPEAERMIGRQVPLSTSIAGWAVRAGQPVLIDDAQHDPRFYNRIDAITGLTTHSLVAVPLIFQKKVIGVVEAINKARGKFQPHDLEMLQALSSSAAIAIENARLYQTEREQARRLQESQAQLIQVEKMAALGRLVASVAHEINNPLQAVQTCLTLAEEELANRRRPEKLNHYLDIAEGEIERIATIIHRMRDFYRPVHRQQRQASDPESFYRSAQEELQSIDLHTIIDNVLLLTNRQLQHRGVEVEREWAGNLPPIEGNPDHLKQVFLNLVLNAVDAMAVEGGTLHIRTALDEAKLYGDRLQPVIRLEFRDVGEGIPPEILPRLFEPLFTTKQKGSGLGLFTSYKIIEAHQGQITVESQVGTGTTFTILLPLTQP